jgi:hypothetical protein
LLHNTAVQGTISIPVPVIFPFRRGQRCYFTILTYHALPNILFIKEGTLFLLLLLLLLVYFHYFYCFNTQSIHEETKQNTAVQGDILPTQERTILLFHNTAELGTTKYSVHSLEGQHFHFTILPYQALLNTRFYKLSQICSISLQSLPSLYSRS